MQVKLGRDTVEFKMFQDYWSYMQKYYKPEDNDSYWEGLINEGNALIEKYKEHEDYMMGLVLAFLKKCERDSKSYTNSRKNNAKE